MHILYLVAHKYSFSWAQSDERTGVRNSAQAKLKGTRLRLGAHFSLCRSCTGIEALQWVLRGDSDHRTVQDAFLKSKMLPQYGSSYLYSGSMKWVFKPRYTSRASHTSCFPFLWWNLCSNLGTTPVKLVTGIPLIQMHNPHSPSKAVTVQTAQRHQTLVTIWVQLMATMPSNNIDKIQAPKDPLTHLQGQLIAPSLA